MQDSMGMREGVSVGMILNKLPVFFFFFCWGGGGGGGLWVLRAATPSTFYEPALMFQFPFVMSSFIILVIWHTFSSF